MLFDFCIALIDREFYCNETHGKDIRALVKAVEHHNVQVKAYADYESVLLNAQQKSQTAAIIIALNTKTTRSELDLHTERDKLTHFIAALHEQLPELPIYLYSTHSLLPSHLSAQVSSGLIGFINADEDTPLYAAQQIIRSAEAYVHQLAPPFFRALLEHTAKRAQSWHCPGHTGGLAFLKHPVGYIFHHFFGENMLRADVCNAVETLGQLLRHSGAIGASERKAAQIFQADHSFFVTNGTSTSNKIVWHSAVSAGDIVLVDRNCHKSNIHALIMIGAIPVFLPPTRNAHGFIGPIARRLLEPNHLRAHLLSHPLARQILEKDPSVRPKMLAITQSTYDGIVYNAEKIKHLVDGEVEVLLFDEAWLPHASFHPFYKDYHAISRATPRCRNTLIFSTQSTHKLLASLSQASQILVQNSAERTLDRHLFNEAYLMHTSTSPQYSIIASCDVAAAMMAPPAGTALIGQVLAEAIAFRQAMGALEASYQPDWWFKVWGPTQPNADADAVNKQESWKLRPGDTWHGFAEIEEDFTLLDPTKCTVLTPGLGMDGRFSDKGIPALLVSKYLAEHGCIVEKTGLYSFFIMFTMGTSQSSWFTLITQLQHFKESYDNNLPLAQVMPEFAATHPSYRDIGLQDLSQLIHTLYSEHDIANLTSRIYSSEIIPAMTPAEAFSQVARRETVRLPLEALEDQIVASLLTPYPPGIPLLVPGERFNQTIVEYLRFIHTFNQRVPGFETDIHGLITEGEEGQQEYYVDCIQE